MPVPSPTSPPSPPPSVSPSSGPTEIPARIPTAFPSVQPSSAPTESPTLAPTLMPSSSGPTEDPTASPTLAPTLTPSSSGPTENPTASPTLAPTLTPSSSGPTENPTASPTLTPTLSPSSSGPTEDPSACPTLTPSLTPSSSGPTEDPTLRPTRGPTRLLLFAASCATMTKPAGTRGRHNQRQHPPHHCQLHDLRRSQRPVLRGAADNDAGKKRPRSEPTAAALPTRAPTTPEPSARPTTTTTTRGPTTTTQPNLFLSSSPTTNRPSFEEATPTHLPSVLPTSEQPTESPRAPPSAEPTSCPSRTPSDELAPTSSSDGTVSISSSIVLFVSQDNNNDNDDDDDEVVFEALREALVASIDLLTNVSQVRDVRREEERRRRRLLQESIVVAFVARVEGTVDAFVGELEEAVASGSLEASLAEWLAVDVDASLALIAESTRSIDGDSGDSGNSGGNDQISAWTTIAVIIAGTLLVFAGLAVVVVRRKLQSSIQLRHTLADLVIDCDSTDDESAAESSFRAVVENRLFDWEEFRVTWDTRDGFVRRVGFHAVKLVPASEGVSCGDATSQLRGDLELAAERDFDDRLAAFRLSVDGLRVEWTVGRVEFCVDRSKLIGDAYNALGSLPAECWRRPFFVTFAGEVGLDAGGCSREFFRLVTDELFDVKYGLFKYATDYAYQLADDVDSIVAFDGDVRNRDAQFVFVGRLLGKTLLESHVIHPHLAVPLLKHIVSEPVDLDDLQHVDVEYWKSLMELASMPSDILESLSLTFAVATDVFGCKMEKNLVPGGADIPVTSDNLPDLLELRLKERLCDVHAMGLASFLRGIYDIIPPASLMLLSANDLDTVLCGDHDISVQAWRNSCRYGGDFKHVKEDHPIVRHFWDILETWDNDKKARLLRWATGASSLPAQGFDYLQGRDGIIRHFALTSVPLDRAIYPRAHTCFNRIDLPLYKSKAELEAALDFVLSSDELQCVFTMD